MPLFLVVLSLLLPLLGFSQEEFPQHLKLHRCEDAEQLSVNPGEAFFTYVLLTNEGPIPLTVSCRAFPTPLENSYI